MALATFRASGSGKLEASSSGLQSAPAETLLNTFDQTVQRPTLGASDSLFWGANYEPVANDELVLTQLVVTLTEPPAPDADGNVPELEVSLAPPGGAAVCVAALTRMAVAADPTFPNSGTFEARKLDSCPANEPGLCLSVRIKGSPTPLFETPLEKLAIGGEGCLVGKVPLPGGKLAAFAPEGAPAPPGSATLLCSWRKQRALPPSFTGLDRRRGLTMRYTAPDHREQQTERTALWRTEMTEVTKVPKYPLYVEEYDQLPWAQPWLPPYIPHHMYGDPQTQKTRNDYLDGAKEMKRLFHSQAVCVQLATLMEVLPTCATAGKAVDALEAVHAFLEDHRDIDEETVAISPNGVRTTTMATVRYNNLPQIDAAATLKLVRRLRLPFERLVRNVWMEGPEVYYDRAKAALEKLLAKEVARRKSLQTDPPPSGPADTLTRRMGVVMSATRIHEGKHAPRTGLLNFPGKPLATKEKVRKFGE